MQKQLKNGNFVHKLEKLLNNDLYRHIIAWDATKTYIDILDPQLMQIEITPKFFRHSKFQSFVRQLNLYGFRKIKGQGRLRFTHPLLLNGQPLASVSNYKYAKALKGPRQASLSLQEGLPELQEHPLVQVPENSIEKQEEEATNQRVTQRQGHPGNNGTADFLENKLTSAMMMQSQYMYWWNMMSMMAGRPVPIFNFNQSAFCPSQ